MEIKLSSNKYPGLVAVVDDRFAEALQGRKYHPDKIGGTFYARRNVRLPDGRQTTRKLHQDILELAGIEIPTGYVVDHRDGDGLNNQLSNLRVCTHSQNQMNRRSSPGSSSQFLGVGWSVRNSKWQAQLTIGGRTQYIGLFDSEYDAALAYDIVAMTEHGAFARLNVLAA